LLALKGFHLALEAFARARRPGWELVLVGSGPEEEFLRRRARELGVARAVCFPGWLERKALFDLLATASCFLLPSLHDSFSFVVLEAMAVGLPAVVLDRGGPALVVDEEVGVKVPVSRPRQVVADLARALETLASDPERRRAMGEAARRRVRERHTWVVRAQEVAALYEEVLARRGPAARPEGAG
jgi:glycosyltransferase involved in cell wall biosynthesis